MKLIKNILNKINTKINFEIKLKLGSNFRKKIVICDLCGLSIFIYVFRLRLVYLRLLVQTYLYA